MQNLIIDRDRGDRIARAIEKHDLCKAMALAAELGVSEAAVSKWKHGHTMSLENACMLASKLDVSLDWLLLGRDTPEWLETKQISKRDIEIFEQSKRRRDRIVKLLVALLVDIPKSGKLD